jgi:hypothetical protein
VSTLVAASTIPSRTIVATDDTTAAPTAARRRRGSATARAPMMPTVAVLDTKPETNPLTSRP